MAGRTAESKLQVRADLRQLKGLQRTLSEVFSKKGPEAFGKSVQAVTRRLQENAKEHAAIAKELAKVERGSKAYKELQKDLKAVNAETRQLTRSLAEVNRFSQTAARSMSRVGGGGFGGGMRRIPGAGVQAPMPSMGGMATMMTAVPFVGALGAGGLMAAAGTYQSRLRYEQAALAATPALMRSRRLLGYRGPRMQEVVERGSSAFTAGDTVTELGTGKRRRAGALGLTDNELGALSRELMRRDASKTFGGSELLGGLASDLMDTSLMIGITEVSGAGAAGRRKASDFVRKQQADAARRIRRGEDPAKVIGGLHPLARKGFERMGIDPAGAPETIRRVVGNRPFDAASIKSAGVRMGMDPSEALQQAAGFAQAAGRPGGDIEAALALSRLGFSGQQTGAAARQLRRSGGTGSLEEVTKSIGNAVTLGLEGSEISEYLQQQTAFLRTQTERGFKFDVSALMGLERGLTGAGVRGYRGQQIAQGFATGVAGVGMRGAKSAAEMRLVEAAGYSGGGPEDYAQALFALQSGEDLPGTLERYMAKFRVPGRRGGAFQARVFQQALGAIGPQLGRDEIDKITRQGLTRTKGGSFAFDTTKAIEAASRVVGTVAPGMRGRAQIERERIGVGGKMIETMQGFERMTNNIAGTVANTIGPSVESIATNFEKWSRKLEEATADPTYTIGTSDALR